MATGAALAAFLLDAKRASLCTAVPITSKMFDVTRAAATLSGSPRRRQC